MSRIHTSPQTMQGKSFLNLQSEFRFSGSYSLSPSFLVLDSLIVHRYHYSTARATLFIPITRCSHGHDHHRRCDAPVSSREQWKVRKGDVRDHVDRGHGGGEQIHEHSIHRVRVLHDFHDRRGVPTCVQGHPERCAGGGAGDPTERFVHEFDAIYLRFSHLRESFVYVSVLLMVDGHSSSSRGI